MIIGSRLCSSLSSLLPILEEKRIEVSKQQRFSTFRKEPASIRHGCIKHCASGGRREDKIGGLAVANLPLGIADGHFLPRRQAFAERRGAAIGERIETVQFGKQSPRGIEQGKEVRGPNFVSSFRTGEFPPPYQDSDAQVSFSEGGNRQRMVVRKRERGANVIARGGKNPGRANQRQAHGSIGSCAVAQVGGGNDSKATSSTL